jgi:uncharacterized protein YqgQ
MSWIYQGKKFTETDIPENGIGFVYHMSVILNGNTYAYIGKKNFFSNVKKKLGKKALALVTDKRLKKYTKEQKANFENSSTELTYQEVKHQFKYEVLEKENYLNANILGRFYKTK